MVNKIQKKICAVLKEASPQPGYGLEDEFSGLRSSKARPADMAAKWKEKYYYLLADLENTKKRLARASALEIEGQRTELLKDVLRMADGLDLALNHLSGEDDSRNIFQGIQGLKGILDQFFVTYEVKPMEALGAVFDPNVHEALGVIRSPEAAAHTVVRVERKGYLYQDKLLRPAQVLVAAG
nr:nucleotide exchange factor GrpE [uncultured Desulfobacter sp.]